MQVVELFAGLKALFCDHSKEIAVSQISVLMIYILSLSVYHIVTLVQSLCSLLSLYAKKITIAQQMVHGVLTCLQRVQICLYTVYRAAFLDVL